MQKIIFCCHLTGNVQEAEELYQDTFLKAVELMKNIDYENNPKSFLISIALRLWKNKKRKYAWRMRIAGTESLIEETAEKMARLDSFKREVENTGYLLTKMDKNMNYYKESNPLLVHMKELDRTIGMQREHLGLSFKVNPNRMKESPKQSDTEKDPMYQFVKGRKK